MARRVSVESCLIVIGITSIPTREADVLIPKVLYGVRQRNTIVLYTEEYYISYLYNSFSGIWEALLNAEYNVTEWS